MVDILLLDRINRGKQPIIRKMLLAFVHLTLVKLYVLYLACRNCTLPKVLRFFSEKF